MSQLNFFEELVKIIDIEKIKQNEPMKNHTSFKVGGPVDFLVFPDSREKLIKLIGLCKVHSMPFFIMGNGTNLIVKDGGYKGVIIKLTFMNHVEVEGLRVISESGAMLSAVANAALKKNLKGLEFASGIPGTVGGAITMNAGAYGPEMKDVVEWAEVMDMEGNILYLSNEELELSYRMSIIQKNNYIVLRAAFKLEEGNYTDIKNRMDELNARRSDKQPLTYPSAGSTFKRPNGYFAAKLIDDAGLKGLSVGGAKVSEKHSGFVINYNNATARDILNLIAEVKRLVFEKEQIELEPEIKIIGEDN